MKRTALPLPRYVLRKRLKEGTVAHYFNVPMWARAAGCLLRNEALGTDYAEAVKRAETVLLPAFDSWLSGGASDAVAAVAAPGTLDWVFKEYRSDRRYIKLDAKTKRVHETGFKMVGGYVLKDGRRLGQLRVATITTAVTDTLYEQLKVMMKGGVEVSRLTTANHAMKTCRRAWNVAARKNPGKLPVVNPFAAMGLKSSDRETPTATFEELQTFRDTAKQMALPSLATAALIGWEWLQRGEAIFNTFDVSHYRPKERPDAVRVLHPKTGEEAWVPLFDDAGVPLYPELMAELDAIKRERIGGLMLVRDWGDRIPWPTDRGDLTHASRKVREVITAAGLRPELSFTSFRHGGFTEGADADLSDAELRAQGRHKSAKVLPKYAKRTMRQVAAGQTKRRAQRTKSGQLSE
jgi:hypothetical protein